MVVNLAPLDAKTQPNHLRIESRKNLGNREIPVRFGPDESAR
jgi:hypothetical protein